MAIKNSNSLLVQFAVNKLTTPYIMETNGRTFTKSMYNDLVKRNPSNWFIPQDFQRCSPASESRQPTVMD